MLRFGHSVSVSPTLKASNNVRGDLFSNAFGRLEKRMMGNLWKYIIICEL